jgi:hypothetical protein
MALLLRLFTLCSYLSADVLRLRSPGCDGRPGPHGADPVVARLL